jgi:hypothetical protein
MLKGESLKKYAAVIINFMRFLINIIDHGPVGVLSIIGLDVGDIHLLELLIQKYTEGVTTIDERLLILHSILLRFVTRKVESNSHLKEVTLYNLLIIESFRVGFTLCHLGVLTQLLAKVEHLIKSTIGYEIASDMNINQAYSLPLFH